MQIRKYPYMFVSILKTKQNFAFFILRTLKLSTREADQYIILFLNVCKKICDISHVRTFLKVKGVKM